MAPVLAFRGRKKAAPDVPHGIQSFRVPAGRGSLAKQWRVLQGSGAVGRSPALDFHVCGMEL